MLSSIYNIDFYTDQDLLSQLPQFMLIWVLSTLKIEILLIN